MNSPRSFDNQLKAQIDYPLETVLNTAFIACVEKSPTLEQIEFLLAGKVFLTSPIIIAIGGLSGSGKSTLAKEISSRSCVEHISSDAIRRELNQNDKSNFDQSYGAGMYTKEQRGIIYTEMCIRAQKALSSGMPVVIEATFLDENYREAIENIAAAEGVPFWGIWCDVPKSILIERLMKRVTDPESESDAGVRVLENQIKALESSMIKWIKISAR